MTGVKTVPAVQPGGNRLFLVVLLLVGAAGCSSKRKENPPPDEFFVRVLSQYKELYRSAPNEIKKSLYWTNQRSFIADHAAKGQAIVDWRGTLSDLSTVGAGGSFLNLTVALGDEEVKPLLKSSYISKSAPIYSVASNLREGQCVLVSGTFYDGKELSITERGGIDEPEFNFSFTRIRACP